MDNCRKGKWDTAKRMICQFPDLVWISRNNMDRSPACLAAMEGNIAMLDFMLRIILTSSTSPEQKQQRLKEAFESKDKEDLTPITYAAHYNHMQCLVFLVENCPNGAIMLEKEGMFGNILAYWAVRNDNAEMLEFVARRASSGLRVLNLERYKLLEVAGPKVKKYFTPQKIQELGLEHELCLVQQCCIFEPDSLVQLMLGVVVQNIEAQMWRIRK